MFSYISRIQNFLWSDEQSLRPQLTYFFLTMGWFQSKTSPCVNCSLLSFLCHCYMNCSAVISSWLLLPQPHPHLLSSLPSQHLSPADTFQQQSLPLRTHFPLQLSAWILLYYSILSFIWEVPFSFTCKMVYQVSLKLPPHFQILQLIFNSLLAKLCKLLASSHLSSVLSSVSIIMWQ